MSGDVSIDACKSCMYLCTCVCVYVWLPITMIPSIAGWLDNIHARPEMVIVMFTVDVLFACFAAKVAGNELLVGYHRSRLRPHCLHVRERSIPIDVRPD